MLYKTLQLWFNPLGIYCTHIHISAVTFGIRSSNNYVHGYCVSIKIHYYHSKWYFHQRVNKKSKKIVDKLLFL